VSGTDLHFSLQRLTNCISRITDPVDGPAESLHELAGRVVRDLNETLCDPASGQATAALVRFFMTVEHGSLEHSVSNAIASRFPDLAPQPDTKCLTLMGTAGDEPDWCDVARSRGHRSIPLMNEESVAQIPMIARLVSELGLEIHQVLKPGADLTMAEEKRDFRVFHVEEAVGSQYIPDQEFVSSRGIRSVLGFGSMLPTGHLFVVILFSKVRISLETALLFRPIALGVRMVLLPHLESKILIGEKGAFEEVERLRAVDHAQSELLEVFRTTVIEQSDKLDHTLDELQTTNIDLRATLGELKDAQSRLVDFEAKLVSRYAAEKLRDASTYKVAFIVGTLINLFGQILVPFLRGRPNVADAFLTELEARPALAALSIIVAYVFPVIVQVHSAVTSRIRGSGAEMRATLIDSKPDPVFRAAADGRIIHASASTRALLDRCGLDTAQDVLGAELWERICETQRRGHQLSRETYVHVDALDDSFFVVHSPGADGAANIYLTAAEPRVAAPPDSGPS
jgi:hypothetical protein